MVNMDLESLADKYFDDGKLFEAEDLYKRLLNANPKNTNALYKLAFINVGKLDYNIAEMLLSAALKFGADIKILKLLAYVKEKQYQLYDAIVMYEQILELEKSEELFVITGNLYIQLELYDNAIHLAKEYVKTYENELAYRRLFLLYLNLSKKEELTILRQEIQEKFPNKGLTFNLLGMYNEFIDKDYEKAIVNYEKAVKMGISISAFDLAQCYRRIGKYDEAEKYCKKILGTYPKKNDVLNLLADLYFSQRKMRKGYKYYLDRELNKDIKTLKNKWDGKDYPNKTILVIADVNDMNCIRNLRYLDNLKSKFKDIIFAASPTMETYLQFNKIKTMPLGEIFTSKYDKYVLLSELQYYLNSTFEHIPYAKGYLESDFVELPNGLNIGLFWKAPGDSMKAVNEYTIDITKYLSKLFDIEGVNYYSFQKGDIFNTLEQYPKINDLTPELNNIEDVAKYVKSMDLIISIDSDVLHLAGAMGIPALAIIPENASWYWFDNTEKTEWYSSVEIVRQNIGEDWTSVADKIIERVIKDNAKCQKVK